MMDMTVHVPFVCYIGFVGFFSFFMVMCVCILFLKFVVDNFVFLLPFLLG